MSEQAPESKQQARWLTKDFSELVREIARQAPDNSRPDFDVVIIGSGYGGAIAASELAGCLDKPTNEELSICILERGKEYLPGMFPSRFSDLPGHARFSLPGSSGPTRGREGLFDVKLGTDVTTIVANGVGGGSLINAGVMEIPRPSVFSDPWPSELQNYESLLPYFEEAKELLGAALNNKDNNISLHKTGSSKLRKTVAFKKLAGKQQYRQAALTIAMQDKTNNANVALNACKLCGDCATGCNYSAKESLDTNLLVEAAFNGVDIFTGVTVLRIDQRNKDDLWEIFSTYTNKNLSERQGQAIRIRAKRVILAAGTLGSSEILLRSQQASKTLLFSEKLGEQFSTNGDMIAAGFGQNQKVNAVANENHPPAEREIGPSITSIIDSNNKANGYTPELVLEELAIPGPLKIIFEETYTTANTFDWLSWADNSRHEYEHPLLDPYAVNPGAIFNTQIYAAMGNDGAGGQLRLKRQDDKELGDGAVEIIWPEINKHPLFETQIHTFKDMETKAGVGGTTIGNPIWQILPDSMRFLIDNKRGPVLTVHPLGGCPMGNSSSQGVVNQWGEVFYGGNDKSHSPKYHGLYILDGSIIPTALGTNPALTISALALRAIRHHKLNWTQVTPVRQKLPDPPALRPLFRDIELEIINRPKPADTVGEFTERLTGTVHLTNNATETKRFVAEITLHYEHKVMADLLKADDQGKLIDPVLRLNNKTGKTRQSYLRIFDYDQWHELRNKNCTQETRETLLNESALLIAPLSGSLTIMRRKASSACSRISRGLCAWLRNRGIRDTWQFAAGAIHDYVHGTKTDGKSGFFKSICNRTNGAWKLASHAGETRLFEYDLKIHDYTHKDKNFFWPDCKGELPFKGTKHITYKRPSNPWRQLMEMTVEEMPCLSLSGRSSILSLDNRYMASVGAPLFRIVKQENQVAALSDIISLSAYLARMLFSIHIWNARSPEISKLEANRLPAKVPLLPEPEVKLIEVDRINNEPIYIRLTHYRGKSASAKPVIMFHGYSASGTTFAHHAPPMDISRYLHQAGRDIWVVDLRTSCGMPTAKQPWTFETVGLKDIPAAIDYVFKATDGKKMDVIAHCMGSVMFSMAVLSAKQPAEKIITEWDKEFKDEYRAQREAIPERVSRVILSQVGPLVVFSPRNIFSAYVTNYLRFFLPLDNYQFRPSGNPELSEQLMDRLLATLPYPDDEIKKENPAWPPWARTEYVGTRHRMDALYGRDFKLGNLDDRTLKYIDDFFGPLNIDTVSQVIHFTRLQMITNRFGRNRFLNRKNLAECWTFPTLSIHGEENGLSDIATLERMRVEMREAGCQFETMPIKGYGHQDCWIGKNAANDVFPGLLEFMEIGNPPKPGLNESLLAHEPWAGPVLGLEAEDLTLGKVIPIGLSARPSLGRPSHIALIPVTKVGEHWCAVHNQQTLPVNEDIPEAAMQIVAVASNAESWLHVKLSSDLFSGVATGVAVLLIHDQSATLKTSAFDENY